MTLPAYLLYVNTSPIGVSDETWTKWWISLHLPALTMAKLCGRVVLYKEVGFALLPKPDHPHRFLALYQTDYERLQNEDDFKPASPEEDSEIRTYKVIQDYNPKQLSEAPSSYILTTEMNPLDRTDFEDWYRTDLLPRISRLPGYKRSRRYQLAGGCEESGETFLGTDYLAIHEVDNLSKAFVSEKAHQQHLTVRTERHIQASESAGGFIRRGWKLIHAHGY